MIQLREYQGQLCNQILTNYKQGITRQILFSPTGGGKTVTCAALMHHATKYGKRALFVVNREPLVDQTVRTIERFGIEPNIIKAGYDRRFDSPLTVGMLQTMIARDDFPDVEMVILDEAHCSIAKSYDRIWDRYPNALIIGATATPFRLSRKESLSVRYQTIVGNLQTADLQELGMLVPCRTIAPTDAQTMLDLDGVTTGADGDFNSHDLQIACNVPQVTQAAIDLWRRETPGERTIVFCTGVKHAEDVAAAFNVAGVAAECITGDTEPDDRRAMYARLDRLETQVLVSCDVLSVGFDLPSVTCGVSLRPTKSKGLYIQQVGRVLRISEGKAGATWLDIAANCFQHGLISDRIALTLDTPTDREPGEAPVKHCPECGTVVHLALMDCPECGHEWTAPLKAIPTQFGEVASDRQNFGCTLKSLCDTRQGRGYKPGWVLHRIFELFPESTLDLMQWEAIGKALDYRSGWAKRQFEEHGGDVLEFEWSAETGLVDANSSDQVTA